jgi:transcriptional regulator with XRE-family HTH domain
MERDEAIRLRIGRNMRRLREMRRMTQVQLAELVGTNNDRHMGQIERGEANVGLDYLAKIADSLSADIAELFFNDEPTPEQPPGVVAIFVSPDELQLLEDARAVLARIQGFSRPLSGAATSPAQPGGSGSPSEPSDDDQ